ncbi:MAG: radical SAM protein [candidate division NC10 bacterium]|nr:radical SAM protein [candidate division NC10 bacterium]
MAGERVLLINTNRMRPVVAPLGLDYVAQALEGSGFRVEILDLAFAENTEEAISGYFQKNSVGAVAVTLRNIDDSYYASQDSFLPQVKEVIKSVRARTDGPIIMGGVGFSLMPCEIMEYCGVDFGIKGEGEEALPLLLQHIFNGEEFSGIPGLVFSTPKGLQLNPPRYLNLKRFSLSRRGAIDNLRYFLEGGMAGFESKRGCDRKCVYCADPVSKGRKIRLRPPKDVADELENLLKQGIDHFHTCDSEFNIPEGHALAICQEIIGRGLGDKIRWYAYCSPVPFSEELALLMRRAGCVGIDFGVDHGNDGMLRRLGRDFTSRDVREIANRCRRYSFSFMFDLLLGGPGETRETLKETVELMKGLDPSRIGVSFGVRLYRGTALGRQVLREGVTSANRNLRGRIEGNKDFLEPIFYVSAELGEGAEDYVKDLIGGDKRFFFAAKGEIEGNYNYNENSTLVQAIKKGYRGAFWDILRRLEEGTGL